MKHSWAQGRDLLTARDVLVIDEAGMVGTRQLERVLSHAARRMTPEARARCGQMTSAVGLLPTTVNRSAVRP